MKFLNPIELIPVKIFPNKYLSNNRGSYREGCSMLLNPSLYGPFWCLIPLVLLVAVISFFAIAMRANQWLYKPGLHSFGTTVPDMDGSAGAIGSVCRHLRIGRHLWHSRLRRLWRHRWSFRLNGNYRRTF